MKFNFKNFRIANFLSKRINTILLIVILLLLLTGHVVCSCCKMSINKVVEKFTGGDESTSSSVKAKFENAINQKRNYVPTGAESFGTKDGKKPDLKGKFKNIMGFLKKNRDGFDTNSGATSSSNNPDIKADIEKKLSKLKNAIEVKNGPVPDVTTEGFTPANTNFGQSSPYLLTSMGGHSEINPNDWNIKDLTIRNGRFGNGVSEILDRPYQPIPLPEGEMIMFETTPFKPECCKNNSAYSLSTGCACMTEGQYNYLVTRGGNNVPYSEY